MTRPVAAPDALERPVIEHYERQLAAYGPTARGMDWRDEASQTLRFDVLCAVLPLEGLSVHEVGAGAGHLLDPLQARGIAADYSGSDLSLAMLEQARRRHPGARFEHRDVLDPLPRPCDVVLGSGLFHVKREASEESWRQFVERAVQAMFASCRRAIAFNLMSDQVDYRSPDLYYAHPGEVLDSCRRHLSRRKHHWRR